jgi:hypothetical protein
MMAQKGPKHVDYNSMSQWKYHWNITSVCTIQMQSNDPQSSAGLSKRGARLRSLCRVPECYCAEQKKKKRTDVLVC